MIPSANTGPDIKYGETFRRHLESMWNLRITHPFSGILLFDDYFKWAFRHNKYHPDIVAAFSIIISNLLYIPLGGTFGSITSPSNFESITRARIHPVIFHSDRTDLLQKYKRIIVKVKFSEEPDEDIVFVQAVKDSIH